MAPSTLETDYFINNSDDNGNSSGGYWEPHTSSIDFCESNYLLMDHIVEPHNVWSSIIGLSLVGIFGILYGNPTKEWRFTIVYVTLIVIGIGSACLHGSLHWCFQSADELPMIYLVIGAFYAILEVDSPRGRPKYPHLSTYLLLLSVINTAVYYKFQQYYIIFLATFNALVIGLLYLHVQIALRLHNENKIGKENINNTIALRFYLWHYIAYIGVASPSWILDQFYCGYLLPLYNKMPFPLQGMTLHVVWHICAGYGAHLFIQFIAACRASTLGMVCDVRHVLGILVGQVPLGWSVM